MNRLTAAIALCLTSCAVEPAGTPDAHAPQPPPPISFILSVPTLVTTTTAAITVTGAPPGLDVTLVVSGNVTGPGLCPPQLAPVCTDVANPMFTLGTVTTDAAGEAVFSIQIPANAPAQVEFQAYGSQRRVFYLSNGVLTDVYAANGDADGDGSSNADELAAGTNLTDPDSDDDGVDDGDEAALNTDPLDPDTDGGGESDGDEVANGRDPLDPADDFGVTASGLVINEVDYDQPGADTLEFVEVTNPTGAPISLTGVALVFVNGSNSTEYMRTDLGVVAPTLPAGGYLVVANALVVVPPGVPAAIIGDSTIQNGAPDGLALVDTVTGTVLDAFSYEGDITAAVITGLPAPVSLVEGTASTLSDFGPESLARIPDGQDTNDASVDWAATVTPTPGAANF